MEGREGNTGRHSSRNTSHVHGRSGAGLHCHRHCSGLGGAHMQEPALSRGVCYQLSHRCDPPFHSMGGSGKTHRAAAAENRHDNPHSLAAGKIKSSFLGRKQGPVFVGFYSIQENKAHKGNEGGVVVGGVFTFYPSMQSKAHQTPSTARPLWLRSSGTIRDWILPPMVSALRELHSARSAEFPPRS